MLRNQTENTIAVRQGASSLSTADQSSAASQSVFYNNNQRISFTHTKHGEVGQMS